MEGLSEGCGNSVSGTSLRLANPCEKAHQAEYMGKNTPPPVLLTDKSLVHLHRKHDIYLGSYPWPGISIQSSQVGKKLGISPAKVRPWADSQHIVHEGWSCRCENTGSRALHCFRWPSRRALGAADAVITGTYESPCRCFRPERLPPHGQPTTDTGDSILHKSIKYAHSALPSAPNVEMGDSKQLRVPADEYNIIAWWGVCQHCVRHQHRTGHLHLGRPAMIHPLDLPEESWRYPGGQETAIHLSIPTTIHHCPHIEIAVSVLSSTWAPNAVEAIRSNEAPLLTNSMTQQSKYGKTKGSRMNLRLSSLRP
ncbi:hypothetical protein BD413DRAFT_502921 [Trametes elegans]|nr:hypothetical protein BD413DRAFT_502921 [Trametes elegans]